MRIAIAVPCYAKVEYATARSLWRLTSLLTAAGIVYDEVEVLGDPDLARARNTLLAAFRRSSADALLKIDADVSFDAMEVYRMIRRPEEYVGANYPRKRLGGGWASTPAPGGRRSGDLVEAALLATGLVRLSRSAVDRMSAASPAYVGDDGLPAAAVCQTGVVDGRWVSEDEGMCMLWRSMGETAWIDESVTCGHVGLLEYNQETTR